MLTHIRLDSKMEREIQYVVNAELFTNKSEFIRDAIRKSIESYKTAMAKELLTENFKSFEGTHLTSQEKKAAFKELLKLKEMRTDDLDL